MGADVTRGVGGVQIVIVDGVRYRREDAERLGLLKDGDKGRRRRREVAHAGEQGPSVDAEQVIE